MFRRATLSGGLIEEVFGGGGHALIAWAGLRTQDSDEVDIDLIGKRGEVCGATCRSCSPPHADIGSSRHTAAGV
jgi:hypothetical protein